MLVLTRKSGEELRIGDDIIVTVVRLQGNRVQIGISAPRSVEIRRQECQPLEFDGTVPAKKQELVYCPGE